MEYLFQRILIIFVAVGGIVLAPFLAYKVADLDILTIAILVGVIGVIFFLSGSVRDQWMMIPTLCGITATINILPANFNFLELSVILITGHFIVEEMVFRKRFFRLGDPVAVFAMTIFMLVVMYHWGKGGIGLRLLGGDSVGARKSFTILMGVASFIVVTLAHGQKERIGKIPFYFLMGVSAALVPTLLTTFYPGATPYVYRFVSLINVEAYRESMVGMFDTQEGMGRIGYLAGFSSALQLFLISKYPVNQWWRPERWWVAVLAILALALCIRTGFRSAMFSFVVITFCGTYCVMGVRALFLAFPLAIVLGVLCIGNGSAFDLPIAVQRTISFLPGSWDPIVIRSTESSNDFRKQIKDVYLEEFAMKSPAIGTGFNYDAKEVNGVMMSDQWDLDPYENIKGFIIRKDYHVGWISLYDTVGIVGGIGFFLLICVMLFRLTIMVRAAQGSPKPILVWLFASVISSVATFFTVFGAIQETMPFLCLLAGLTWLVWEDWKEEQAAIKPAIATPAVPAPDPVAAGTP